MKSSIFTTPLTLAMATKASMQGFSHTCQALQLYVFSPKLIACPWIEKPVGFHKNWRNWSHRFSINCSVNLIFFKKMIYQFRYRFTGKPVLSTSFGGFQPLLADQFTGFDTGLPVIPIGKPVYQPVYRFLTSQI
jgi:hypothetical protein